MITIEIGPDPFEPAWTRYQASCVHRGLGFGITYRVLNEAPIGRVLPHVIYKLKQTTHCDCELPPSVQALLGVPS